MVLLNAAEKKGMLLVIHALSLPGWDLAVIMQDMTDSRGDFNVPAAMVLDMDKRLGDVTEHNTKLVPHTSAPNDGAKELVLKTSETFEHHRHGGGVKIWRMESPAGPSDINHWCCPVCANDNLLPDGIIDEHVREFETYDVGPVTCTVCSRISEMLIGVQGHVIDVVHNLTGEIKGRIRQRNRKKISADVQDLLAKREASFTPDEDPRVKKQFSSEKPCGEFPNNHGTRKVWRLVIENVDDVDHWICPTCEIRHDGVDVKGRVLLLPIQLTCTECGSKHTMRFGEGHVEVVEEARTERMKPKWRTWSAPFNGVVDTAHWSCHICQHEHPLPFGAGHKGLVNCTNCDATHKLTVTHSAIDVVNIPRTANI